MAARGHVRQGGGSFRGRQPTIRERRGGLGVEAGVAQAGILRRQGAEQPVERGIALNRLVDRAVALGS